MTWLLQRLAEPSTHAGIAVLLQAAKAFFPQYAVVADALSLLFGGIAVTKPENPARPF